MIFNSVKFIKACLFLLVISSLFSCTPRKNLLYLTTGEKPSKSTTETSLSRYILQQGDMLYIKVLTLDDKTYKLFNADWGSSTSKSELNLFLESYTISDSGFVDLPICGSVFLQGLTLEEAQKVIQKKITPFLIDATVTIKLLNYKITVLGEVNRPGTIKVYDNNIDLLEAVSLAGDLTVWGNRKNIMVLRRNEENKMAYLDITNVNVINSEFFQLKPDDVVYVQANVSKSLGFKEFPFTILFSSITTVIVLINFLK